MEEKEVKKIEEDEDLNSDFYWKGIPRETDAWYKAQIEGLKKAKSYLESLGLDAEEIIFQFEYMSEYNKNRLSEATIQLIADLLLIKFDNSYLEYKMREMCEDSKTIDEVFSNDPKAKDSLNFNDLIKEGKELYDEDYSNCKINLNFKIIEEKLFEFEELLNFIEIN